jgi:demethylmenaquinone methyltransferase/2-methoxy-6-polyprenyl-1,4-benzoquinol methylase
VLKPGGRLVILEFSRPRKGIWNLPYQFYCSVITPLIGKMVSRSGDAYKYLTASVEAFPEGQAFIDILKGIGFSDVFSTRLSAGICTIYVCSK